MEVGKLGGEVNCVSLCVLSAETRECKFILKHNTGSETESQ